MVGMLFLANKFSSLLETLALACQSSSHKVWCSSTRLVPIATVLLKCVTCTCPRGQKSRRFSTLLDKLLLISFHLGSGDNYIDLHWLTPTTPLPAQRSFFDWWPKGPDVVTPTVLKKLHFPKFDGKNSHLTSYNFCATPCLDNMVGTGDSA